MGVIPKQLMQNCDETLRIKSMDFNCLISTPLWSYPQTKLQIMDVTVQEDGIPLPHGYLMI